MHSNTLPKTSGSRLRKLFQRKTKNSDTGDVASASDSRHDSVVAASQQDGSLDLPGRDAMFGVPLEDGWADSLEPYIYHPVKHGEIRIFWMQLSGRFEAEVVGLLETVDLMTVSRGSPISNEPLNDRKEYTALSYAWGPTYEDGSHLTDAIICDGNRLSVTANVKQALRCIRAHGSDELTRLRYLRPYKRFDGMSPLWIDAICINQNDLQERSSQVQMMGDIFTRSGGLIIWLGEPDDGSLGDAQRELFRRLSSMSSQDQHPITSTGEMIDQWHNVSNVLESILSRPWFSRRWVIQECASRAVPSCLMMGTSNCNRTMFTDILKWANLLGLAIPLQPPHTSDNIFQALHRYDKSQCQDDRDRVFALKGLTKDFIPVDYNQDIRDTYLTLARRVAFRIPDGDDFARQFLSIHSREQQQPSVFQAFRMLALASCKKPENRSEFSMESWLPDCSVLTKFESKGHQRAVEVSLRDYTTAECDLLCDIHLELVLANNGYCFYATEGIVMDAKASCASTAPVGYHNDEQMDPGLSSWLNSMLELIISHCREESAESDRLWLTMATWSPKNKSDHRMLAFFLRPGERHTSFQDMPVYRLVSCLMVEELFLGIRAPDGSFEDDTASNQLWQLLAQQSANMSWQTFYLE